MVSAYAEANDDDAVPCDFCCSERAVVYCRADSARLCLACDRKVHAANTVSSRHNRSLLCDHCAASPAAIFCSSPPHRLVLCSNCDFNAHHADDHRHERRAVDPFSGCPAGTVLTAALGLGDEKGTLPSKEEEGWDWEAPQVFSWDDLILPPTTTPFHGYQAMRIPPPRKDTNSSCGKRKEEIHRQISKLIIDESDGIDYSEEIMPVMEFRSLPLENLKLGKLDDECGYTPVFVEAVRCEVSNLQSDLNANQMAVSNPVVVSCEQQIGSSSLANATLVDSTVQVASYASLIQANPTTKENLSSVPPKDEVPDRSSVISRYKEKRKTRRYDKLIRYESRKARADTRVRIKGRFAKANQLANP